MINIKYFLPIYKKNLYRRKGLFVHIPKNAGTSVVESLYGSLYRRNHTPIYILRQILGRSFHPTFKFCVVREPVDRLHSLYKYFSSGGNGSSDKDLIRYFDKNISSFQQFIDFIYTKKLFCWHPMFLPQFFWVSINGEVAVDKVFYMENLEELQSYLNISLPSINVSKKVNLLISDSDRTKIEEMYQIDFQEFYNSDNC